MLTLDEMQYESAHGGCFGGSSLRLVVTADGRVTTAQDSVEFRRHVSPEVVGAFGSIVEDLAPWSWSVVPTVDDGWTSTNWWRSILIVRGSIRRLDHSERIDVGFNSDQVEMGGGLLLSVFATRLIDHDIRSWTNARKAAGRWRQRQLRREPSMAIGELSPGSLHDLWARVCASQ